MAKLILTAFDFAQNEIQNVRIQNLSSAPSTPVSGQVYYNTTSNKLFYYNGSSWVDLSAGTTYAAGTGLTLTTSTFAIDPAYASFTNYYTKTQIDAGYQPLDADLTAIAALSANGLLRKTAGTWGMDSATYLTANQTITLSGDASGSGATSIAVTIAAATVTGKALTGYAVGTNAALAATDTILGAFGKVQAQLNAKLSAEADTLSTVTGRGATTATAVTISNSAASTNTTSGALIVTGGVGIGGNANIGGNLTLTGNLTVNGTTTTVNSTVTTIDDPVITLGGDTAPASDDNKDRGVEFRWHNGTVAKVGFFGLDDSTGKFTFIPDATNTSEVFSGTKGIIDATILGADVSGAVASASALATARSITQTGDVSWTVNFDGSANVSATATIAATTVTGKLVTGFVAGSNTAVAATDTILEALQKLQGQVSARALTSASFFIGTTSITLGRASAAQTLNGVSIDGSAESLGNTHDSTKRKIWHGTQAAYDAIGTKDANTVYHITDATAPPRKYSAAIAGAATSEVITHNLGTRDVVVSVARAATPWDQVECDVEMTSTNTITLRFATAPTAGEYRITVIG